MADKKTSLELLQKSENVVDTKDIREQIFKAKALRDFDKHHLHMLAIHSALNEVNKR